MSKTPKPCLQGACSSWETEPPPNTAGAGTENNWVQARQGGLHTELGITGQRGRRKGPEQMLGGSGPKWGKGLGVSQEAVTRSDG